MGLNVLLANTAMRQEKFSFHDCHEISVAPPLSLSNTISRILDQQRGLKSVIGTSRFFTILTGQEVSDFFPQAKTVPFHQEH